MITSLEEGVNPDDPGTARAGMMARLPLGRYAETADVANLMLFLASDESAFLTGGVYPVDGGMSAI